MEIRNKVWCLFEQSGTFKNEFKKLGYDAVDVDIQNNFGETDYQIDIFSEIEKAYEGGQESIFDKMTKDDLIMAFFPCIYFCQASMTQFSWGDINYRSLNTMQKTEKILKRLEDRTFFYGIAIKMFAVAENRGLRLIMENPWGNTYLQTFILKPSLIDKNRMLRGDYFIKPTAYWYVNCVPTFGMSIQKDKKQKKIDNCKRGAKAGLCSEERSLISPDYARNFICDFILGKEQKHTMRSLF